MTSVAILHHEKLTVQLHKSAFFQHAIFSPRTLSRKTDSDAEPREIRNVNFQDE